MRSLRQSSYLLAGATGLLFAGSSAAFALAQGPGYKSGPIIGTMHMPAPKPHRAMPNPPPPPTHMGGTGHMGGGTWGSHGAAWHVGAWGAPRSRGWSERGGSWHVSMWRQTYEWRRNPSQPSGPRPAPGWVGRPPLGIHPIGVHFYGMASGSLGRLYGAGGSAHMAGDRWQTAYGYGAATALAQRYGHLEHGFSPLLPPSNWGHGPQMPPPPQQGGGPPKPVAWHHPRQHGRFAWLRHNLAHRRGRVVVIWARFAYHPGGKRHLPHDMHASSSPPAHYASW